VDFLLRRWNEEDVESLAKYADNLAIAQNLRNIFPSPYTEEDALWYINDILNKGEERQCLRAIEINGEAVGNIGVFLMDDVYCKSAELGYWLGEPFWGHGIMSRAIHELCSYTFDHYEIIRIFAKPFAHNIASRRALEKSDFELEGILRKSVYKNGKIYDSCIYALTRK
jgi:ribosomal-protein-alanine N-acetyltransferase